MLKQVTGRGGMTVWAKSGKDRRNYRVGDTRVYRTEADRERALKALQRRGFNHFVLFTNHDARIPEANGPAMVYGIASWVPQGQPYIER